MRTILLLSLVCGLAVLAGCQRSGPTLLSTGDPSAAATATERAAIGPEGIVGLFDVTIDPGSLTAQVESEQVRAGQFPQALSYDLDIARFLGADSFRVTNLGFDGNGDLRVTFRHQHPFPAPDFTTAISGQNRADLGYTGRLLILADLDASQVATHTFFASTVANTDLVLDPDGYVNPGDLMHVNGLTANTFPYVLLADEAKDNRTGVSNGGIMTGSYDAPNGGWQRANIGVGNTGWTGYDYLHGGQAVTNSFTLRANQLSPSPISFRVAILIKYTDPRGQTGKSRRFPPSTVDPLAFAYRLPFAALDASVIRDNSGTVSISGSAGSTASLAVSVRDWDATASEASTVDLSGLSDARLIQPGGSGSPTLELSCPDLSTAIQSLTLSGSHTGFPNDELNYAGVLVNQLGIAPAGAVRALYRATDPEANDPNFPSYHFGVDPNTLAPSAPRAILPVTYQAFTVQVEGSSGGQKPVITAVDPAGIVGLPCETVTFSATATNDPTDWSWDFGGGADPNASADPTPTVTLGDPGDYIGTVTASNTYGTSDPFQFSYTVAAPQVPNWTFYDFAQTGGFVYNDDYTAIVEHDGKLAVCFTPRTNATFDYDVMLAQSTVADPAGPADWVVSPIYTNTQYGEEACLVYYNGRLCASWWDAAINRIYIALANSSTPMATSDWTTYPVGNSWFNAGQNSLAVVNGYLAMAYCGFVSNGDLAYARATVADPADINAWAIQTVDPVTNNGWDTDIVDLSGAVAISYRNKNGDVRIALASTTTPATTSDWTTSLVEANATFFNQDYYLRPSMVRLGDRLALTYSDLVNFQLTFALSGTLAPTGPSDWLIYDIASLGGNGGDADMAFVDNRLAIAYHADPSLVPNQLRCARALTCIPMSPADWDSVGIDPPAGSGGNKAHNPAIVGHDRKLYISFNTYSSGPEFAVDVAQSDGVW